MGFGAGVVAAWRADASGWVVGREWRWFRAGLAIATRALAGMMKAIARHLGVGTLANGRRRSSAGAPTGPNPDAGIVAEAHDDSIRDGNALVRSIRAPLVDLQSGPSHACAMDSTLVDYFTAWNETSPDERRELLGQCLSGDAELIDPTGRWQGIVGLSERIGNYHASAPGTKVVPASGVDEHNGIERYAWKIVDPGGNELMEGLDIAERDSAGRLQRIVMFHGPLPAPSAADALGQA